MSNGRPIAVQCNGYVPGDPVMTPTVIYGPSDVARALDVKPNLLSMWLARYSDTPAPAYRTLDGRAFWDDDGLQAWRAWRSR